jgi:hypothetical protein
MAAGGAPQVGSTQTAEPQPVGGFVVNLCSSTTPMALPHPDSPELKRFSFFVSRRLEDNRERFRLHMGYFATLAEAEEWLAVVREIYPGACASEAPGKKLRERAAALAAQSAPAPAPVRQAAAPARAPVAPVANRVAPQVRQPVAPARAPARVAAPVAQQVRPAPVAAPPIVASSRVTQANAPRPVAARLAAALSTPARAPAARANPAMNVPTVHAAPAARAPQAPVPQPQRTAAPVARPQAAGAPRPQMPVQTPTAQVSRPPQAPAQRVAPRLPAQPQPRAAAPAPAAKSLSSHSNVREVMASLDETGETRMMAVPAAFQQHGGVDPSSLSDTQVLKILEQRRTESTEGASDEANTGISLLKPDDTGTRRALKEAVRENAPVAFAVQLQWSVQPVELDKVAPLAIFSAYTLYTVEGSREGRKWYGLRLGFFSDAISAKQVAHYVRSEFASVAVVPVSPQERARATDDGGKAVATLPRKTHEQSRVEEFKLFDDTNTVPAVAPPARPTAAAPAPAAAAPKPVSKPLSSSKRKSGGGKVRAKERRSEKTLEETLEILGASELEMDNGRGEVLNDTGVRHLRVEVQKETPFSRLLERLSERTRRS